MTSSGAQSPCATLAVAVLVEFAISLVGCASFGPITPVTVSNIGSVAGTWQGVLYGSGSEPEYIELTIREDGSYEVVSRRRIGESRGRGTVVVSDGRLVFQGEKGRGVGTLLSDRGGNRVLEVEAVLSDNSTLSARLSRPSR